MSREISIREACQTLGFPSPPVDKRALKQRFVELTKKHHPDRGGPHASASKMAAVTESYKLLRSILEMKIGSPGGARLAQASAGQRDGPGSFDDKVKAAGSGFSAPAFAVSSEGMWLPWQKAPASSTRMRTEAMFENPTEHADSFVEFATKARTVANREANIRKEAAVKGAGSHGFSAAHFDAQRATREAARGSGRPTSMVMLALAYYKDKVLKAPRAAVRSLRFIITGR